MFFAFLWHSDINFGFFGEKNVCYFLVRSGSKIFVRSARSDQILPSLVCTRIIRSFFRDAIFDRPTDCWCTNGEKEQQKGRLDHCTGEIKVLKGKTRQVKPAFFYMCIRVTVNQNFSTAEMHKRNIFSINNITVFRK